MKTAVYVISKVTSCKTKMRDFGDGQLLIQDFFKKNFISLCFCKLSPLDPLIYSKSQNFVLLRQTAMVEELQPMPSFNAWRFCRESLLLVLFILLLMLRLVVMFCLGFR